MRKILLTIISIVILAGLADAGVYVAGGGADYRITYPDDWYRVPHGEVRYFLDMQGVEDSSFSYDAVFALRSPESFYEGPYLFLCSSPNDSVNEFWTDTLLQATSEEYGKNYVEGTLAENIEQFEIDRPVYDQNLNAVATLTTIDIPSGKKLLFDIRKIYEKGLVVLLCYMPENAKQETIPVFLDILNSFTYSGAGVSKTDDDIKIVDVSKSDELPSWIIIVVIAVVILVATLFFIKKY